MNKPRRLVRTLMLVSCLALTPHVIKAQEQSTEAVAMNSVIKAIRSALVEAQTNNVAGFPQLTKATISLNTLTSKEGGVVFKFLVFSIGTKRGTEETSVLTFELTPPPTTDTAMTASIEDKVKLALAQALTTAKQTVLEINREGQPKLKTSRIEIELKFAVKKSGSASAEVQLLPIGVEGTGDLKRNQVHSLKLVFGT